MWHEARRQERKLRKVIVDYKKRSERRHQYYERIKQDPTKFLQVHGRKSKIHLDGTVAAEADNNNHMMPWQGDNVNMIDRFDVRAHLDYYREAPKNTEEEPVGEEEKKCNFERYRVLIWNEYKKISEQQHLKQIYIDEQFPELASQQKQKQEAENQKHLLAQNRVTIGYNYEDSAGDRSWQNSKGNPGRSFMSRSGLGDGASSDEDDDDFDILQELEEIPPLSEISIEAVTAMDEIGAKKFGLSRGSFGDCLVDDQNHMDKVSAAKDMESEKRKFSGRKSRRERRLVKDEQLRGRCVSALSYVCPESSESSESSDSDTSSSSDSSDDSRGEEPQSSEMRGKIEYITSFGGESASGGMSSMSSSTNRRRERKKRSKSHSRSPQSRKIYRSDSRSPHHYEKSSDRRSMSRERRSRHSGSTSYARRSRSRERSRRSRSRSRETDRSSHKTTARLSRISQSTDSLMKSLSKHASAEEKAAAIKKLTPQQKLKIKMQRALNKQLKVDRHADMEKRMVKQQELLEREGDLRELSRKIKKRDCLVDEIPQSGYSDAYR